MEKAGQYNLGKVDLSEFSDKTFFNFAEEFDTLQKNHVISAYDKEKCRRHTVDLAKIGVYENLSYALSIISADNSFMSLCSVCCVLNAKAATMRKTLSALPQIVCKSQKDSDLRRYASRLKTNGINTEISRINGLGDKVNFAVVQSIKSKKIDIIGDLGKLTNDAAEAYFASKEYAKAVEQYKLDADRNNALSQYKLGLCYYYGLEVGQNFTKAVEWFQKSANLGCKESMYMLGWCCWLGFGTEKNGDTSLEYWTYASNSGHPESRWVLGTKLYIDKDYSSAFNMLESSFKDGCFEAAYLLGLCYLYGKGAERDYDLAYNYLQLAKEKEIALLDKDLKPYTSSNICRDFINSADLKKLNESCGYKKLYKKLTDYCHDAEILHNWQGMLAFKMQNRSNDVTLSQLPFPIYFNHDTFNFEDINIDWQKSDNTRKNFVINYSPATKSVAIDIMNQLVMTVLMSFPISKVHLNVVNLQMSKTFSLFMGESFDKVRTIVSSEDEFKLMCDRFRQIMKDDMRKFTCSKEELYAQKGEITSPYELVIMPNPSYTDLMRLDGITPLIENGNNSGIYFILLNDKSIKTDDKSGIIKQYTDIFHAIDIDKLTPESIEFTTYGIRNNGILNQALEFIRRESSQSHVKAFDWNQQLNLPYTKTENVILAPIGYDGNSEIVNFAIDDSHVHSFVIGATGSGKTRFLHDILLSISAKYSPEEIELYAIDFKGVEMNCYKDIPHSRVVLVDEADDEVTLGVIKELRHKMEERIELFKQSPNGSVSNFASYNEQNPAQHLPRILLVVDECQTLFTFHSGNSRIKRDMVDIIASIAQKGRSFGIHLLFATQSLSNTPELGKDILNQISEHYILPCVPGDACRLVPDGEQRETEKAIIDMQNQRSSVKGQCFYQGTDGHKRFIFNYVSESSMQRDLIQKIISKSNGHVSNGQTYFSGSMQYSITKQLITSLSENKKWKRNISALLGQGISIEQTPAFIPLKDDISENILLLGINSEQFVTRTSMSLFYSLMKSNSLMNFGYDFYIIDCYDNEDMDYYETLYAMDNEGMCTLAHNSSERGNILLSLCEQITNNDKHPAILFIHGQEKFAELKQDRKLSSDKTDDSFSTASLGDDIDATLALMNSLSVGTSSNKQRESMTFKQAILYILENGPEKGIHTIMQLDQPSHFLFPSDGYVNHQQILSMFRHIILHRMEETSASLLRLRDDVHPENLKNDPMRLRAIYYDSLADTTLLMTPYMMPTENDIK